MFRRRAGEFIRNEAKNHFTVLHVGEGEDLGANGAEPIVNDMVSILSGSGNFERLPIAQVKAKEFTSVVIVEANPASRIRAFGNHFAIP